MDELHSFYIEIFEKNNLIFKNNSQKKKLWRILISKISVSMPMLRSSVCSLLVTMNKEDDQNNQYPLFNVTNNKQKGI